MQEILKRILTLLHWHDIHVISYWMNQTSQVGLSYQKVCHTISQNGVKMSPSWQNQQCGCAPSEDSDQTGLRPVWSESLLCTQWVAKDPSFLHEDAQADLSLRWAHSHFVGFVTRWLKCIMLYYCRICSRTTEGMMFWFLKINRKS